MTDEVEHDLEMIFAALRSDTFQISHLFELPSAAQRLRERIAAMREIVQAVATEDTCAYEGDAGDDVHCVFCTGEDDWREAHARNELHYIVHTPACPVTKARALLAAQHEQQEEGSAE